MGRFNRDDEGRVLNPPTSANYEAAIGVAQHNADQGEIDRLSQEYRDWQDDQVDRIESWESDQEAQAQADQADRPTADSDAQADQAGPPITGGPAPFLGGPR